MAKVNQIEKKALVSNWNCVKFQILTHCFLNDVQLSPAEIECLTLLGIEQEAEISPFCIKAFEKNLEFIVDLNGLDTQWVKGDPGRLRQVLNNLVSNAIKFTREGEILLKCKSKCQDGLVLLTVDIYDTGIGISDEVKPK